MKIASEFKIIADILIKATKPSLGEAIPSLAAVLVSLAGQANEIKGEEKKEPHAEYKDPAVATVHMRIDDGHHAHVHVEQVDEDDDLSMPEARVELVDRAATARIEVVVRCGSGVVPRHSDSFFVTEDHRALVLWLLACNRAFSRVELHDAFSVPGDDAIDILLTRLCKAQLLRPVPVPPYDRD